MVNNNITETIDFPFYNIKFSKRSKILQIELKANIDDDQFIDVVNSLYDFVLESKFNFILFDFTQGNVIDTEYYFYFLNYILNRIKLFGISKIGFIVNQNDFGKLDIVMSVINKGGVQCKQFLNLEEALEWFYQEYTMDARY